jgi:hypothetical protein
MPAFNSLLAITVKLETAGVLFSSLQKVTLAELTYFSNIITA